MLQKFYKTIFKTISNDFKFIETRQILENKVVRKFFDINNIDKVIEYTKDKENMYFGISGRKTNFIEKGRKNIIAGSYVSWLDLDLPKPYKDRETNELLKQELLECVESDIILSEYFAVVDSGHGLQIYYYLDKLMSVNTAVSNNKTLVKYCLDTNIFKELVDARCTDAQRLFRAPGSINSKEHDNKYECKILRIKNNIFKGFSSLNKIEKEYKNSDNKYSTKEAFKLLGLSVPDADKNIPCMLPGHDDNKPSFRYYDKTDTWYCFTCKKGGNGLSLLKHMGRDDLLSSFAVKIEEKEDITGYYRLSQDGKLFVLKKNDYNLVMDLCTNKIIQVYDNVNNSYRVFLYYENKNKVIEVTDFPSSKQLRSKIYSSVKLNVSIPKESNLNELLSVFLQLAVKVKKLIIFNKGINDVDEGYYFFNNRTYPYKMDYIYLNDENMKNSIVINEELKPDLNTFVTDLKLDGNYTHILALLWGISACVKDYIISRFELFPMLIATGISNSGKSKLASIIRSMYGTQSETLGATNFVMIKNAQRYGTIPIHFEEFTETQLKNKDDLIKRICTEKIPLIFRGTQQQKLNEYPIRHPLVITGEENIYTKGILTRAIVLNVSSNMRKHNNDAYKRWTEFCNTNKLMVWFHNFLKTYWLEFKEHFMNIEIESKNRDDVKRIIIKETFNFLIDKGLLRSNILDFKLIEKVFNTSATYTETVSSNIYDDYLSGVLSFVNFDDLELVNYNNDSLVKDLCDNTFFNVRSKYVVLATTKYVQLYKHLNNDKYINNNKYDAGLMQSPDYINIFDSRILTIKSKINNTVKIYRKRKLLFLKVSSINKELFFNILCHKINIAFNINDEGAIMNEADKILNHMVDGFNSNKILDISEDFI